MRAVTKIAAVAVLVLSLGLHWAALQTLAWTGMFLRYAQEGSVQEALSKTFDGKHPCPLCKAIQEGRADEKRQEQQQVKPGSKLDLGVVWQAAEFVFDPVLADLPEWTGALPKRSDDPPKPRPRGLPLLPPLAV